MTTIALYENSNLAQQVHDQLVDSGIPLEDIGVASREPKKSDMDTDVEVQTDSNMVSDVTGGSATGVVTGAAIGFLAGAAALTIPGFGALLVTGPLAAALGGSSLAANTALGATIGGVGGLVSGLVKAGVDETEAKRIEEHLQNGAVMIAVKDDEMGTYTKMLENSSPASIVKIAD